MKTTKITTLLLVAAVMAVGCSKDDGVSPPSSQSSSVTLKNQVDASRLSSMSLNDDIWSRSGAGYAGAVVAPDSPAVPAGTVDLTAVAADYPYNAQDGDVLHIPAGKSYTQPIGFFWNGSDLYVEGDLTLDSTTWGKGTIYILDGGSVTFPAGYALSNIVVKSWGDMVFNGSITLNASSAMYNYSSNQMNLKGSGDHKYSLQINTSFESVGTVAADVIEIVGASQWEAPRVVKFGGCVSVGTFDVSNYGDVYLSEAGLTADDIDLHSYSNIYMTGGTLVQVAKAINFENYSCFVNSSSEYAVIKAGVVNINNNTFINRINGGPVDLNYTTIEDDKSETAIQWTANVVFNKEVYIASNGCHGGSGTDPDEPKEPVLEHDAVVTSPSIERISATSIDFNDGRVFVSWHEAEANYQGYIDVVNMESMKIEATLHTTELDFNHMYINDGVAYVTGGDNKRGAFYSEVAYSSGGSSVSVDVNYVEGSSGNAITIEDDVKWVVSGSNGGLTRVAAADAVSYTDIPEAKFVEPYNGGMAVLAGLSSTSIYEYALDGSLSKSYEVGAIDPIDGKNTLHADGETIYACLSTGGLVKATNGVVDSSLSLTKEQIGSVNCVDTDDDYIYIANGTRGLTIVDKSSWETVKEYTLGGASANYIKLGEDGYIYVAYGLKGVHRFRLVK